MNSAQLLTWISAHPAVDLNILLGAGGLSLVLEKLLTKYQVVSKKVAFLALHAFSLVTALVAWYLSHIPATDAAGIYGALAIAASWWHRFMISGIYQKDIEPVLEKMAADTSSITSPNLTPPQPGV